MKKLILCLLCLFMFLPGVKAEEKFINLYLFHSSSCPHCKDELAWFDEYLDNKENVKLYTYELGEGDNYEKYNEVKKILNNSSNGVPFLVIGEEALVGYGSGTPMRVEMLVEDYLNKNYEDKVGKYLGVKVFSGEVSEEGKSNEEVLENDNHSKDEYEVPILGKFDAKDVSLPILAVIMGFVDGFNPCALWILLFLITMLFNIKNKKKMWILGLTFIVTSGLVYMLFMVSWLNLAVFMNSITAIRVMISVFAVVFGLYNIYNYIRTRNSMVGCNVTNEKSRNKIMDRIRAITNRDKFILSIIGIMVLAVSVNVLELFCSLGLPVIFTQVLAINDLSTFKYAIYIFLYIVFFLIDDIVIFIIAMKTLEIKAISNKYTKYSHLIGGIIMLLIGLLMFIKPEWLMFNF